MQPEALKRLQQRADRLTGLAQELAAATPQWSEGSDPTGRVVVVLGPDGLPAEIRIRDGWQQRLDPEHLAAAVMAAHDDALRLAMRAWTRRLDDTGWWRRKRDVDEFPDDGTAPNPALRAASPVNGRVHRDVEFSEQVLTALQTVQDQAGERPSSVEGTDDGRHVTVRLGAGGMSGCEIEPRWARNCGGATISAALARALSRAKADVVAPDVGHRPDVDVALSDALATLSALTDRYRTGGGMR